MRLLIAILIGLSLCGCDEAPETHHWRITDLRTGKVYIGERNDLTSDQPASRECYRHVGDGCTFQLHDGTWVEIDNSFSYQTID
jgi:hypothetical protein